MWWWHWHTAAGYGLGWWAWSGTLALIGIGLLVAVIYAVRRRPVSASGGRPAEEVLAERYARGEIDADEFRERQSVLRGQQAGRRAP